MRETVNLDAIYGRLNACLALFHMIHAEMDSSRELCDAMYGACTLLQGVVEELEG